MQPSVQIDCDSLLAIESPEFAVRFGRLLTATRRRSKRSIEKLAASSPGGFGAAQLRHFEEGTTTVDESTVENLCLLYSADVGLVLPARLPVTIADGRVLGLGASAEFSPCDPTSLLIAYLRVIRRMRNQRTAPAIVLRRDDVLVLARYLDIDGAEVVERLSTLMHASAAQRKTMAMLFATGAIVIGLTAGGHASADGIWTSDDLSANSAKIELVVADVQPDPSHETDHAVADDAPVEPPVRRPDAPPVTPPVSPPITASITPASITAQDLPQNTATISPPATTLSAPPVTVSGSVPFAEMASAIAEPVLVDEIEQELLATSLLEPSAVVESASIAVIDQAANVVDLSLATRVRPPDAAPPLTAASAGPPPNQSGCNPDPSEAVMSVVIPDIGYTCPVYAGGQSMIDAGFVTLVTDGGASPVLATRPGEPGTLWLAGHRSTHGSAFSRVPDLADGAFVTVTSDGVTATYRVVGRSHFEVRGDRVIDGYGDATAEATWASIIRDDLSGNLAPRLVLQTCEGENFRWMIYADLVT